MNLNEAFQFQNVLTNLGKQTDSLLRMSYNTTRTTQKHNRRSVNPDAEDAEMEVVSENACSISADNLIAFYVRVVEEKEKLARAISTAKRNLSFDFDSECAINTVRREAINRLRALNGMKPQKRTTRGSDFKFNVNGDQVPYSYTVDETIELSFDKSSVREQMKALALRADEMSKALDQAMVSVQVAYEPLFNIHDCYEDIVAEVLASPSE